MDRPAGPVNPVTGNRPTSPHYTPLSLRQVQITDAFWTPRIAINRQRTLPHIYQACRETGRIAAFRSDWQPTPDVIALDPWGGTPVMYWDSDVAKWIEAASYSLITHPDPVLDALLDEVIALIAQAQQSDGYLNTWFTTVDPRNRWRNLRDWHELYNAGHLIEAGVAHFQATGKRSLLDVVQHYADYIATQFGPAPEQLHGYCGHAEIELALVKLYGVTGDARYLALSLYFVSERGQQPHYFDQEARLRGEDPATFRTYEHNQAHRPVREQPAVVGHAVRAVYLYSAMADLVGAYGDMELHAVCRQLWTHLTTKRMYVTGGIGTAAANEGFTRDYDLPNETAFAETCAAIGVIFWAQRMLCIDLDRRYADMLELALYNAALSGASITGESFFYDNPLASSGTHHRQPWFRCPCCPPNVARLLASLGTYIYAQSESDAVIHLYVQSSGLFHFNNQPVTLRQETRYPWDGTVTLSLDLAQPVHFGLRLRIPGWCSAPRLFINWEEYDLPPVTVAGYARIERLWQPDDTITLDLPMPIERVYAHPDIVPNTGQVALQRGPLLYCLEQVDHTEPLHRITLPKTSVLTHRFAPDTLGGVVTLHGSASVTDTTDWQTTLYRPRSPAIRSTSVTAIPYFAWDNRSPGPMRVWIPES